MNKHGNYIINWLYLGWVDILTRYRRTIVGPFWVVLSMSVTVACLGIVYGNIFNMDLQYFFPYITTGMIIWTFIASSINECCNTFINYKYIVQNMCIRPYLIVFRTISRNVIIFFHNMVVFIIIALIFKINPGWSIVGFILGLLLLFLTCTSIGIILAFLSARFRDVPQIVSSLLGVVFLITPIFWTSDILKGRQLYLINYNPVARYLDIVRGCLLGHWPSSGTWVFVVIMTSITCIFSYYTVKRYEKKLVYWL